jgi:hypothetical protein
MPTPPLHPILTSCTALAALLLSTSVPAVAGKADIAKALSLGDTKPLNDLNVLFESTARPQTEEENAEKATRIRTFSGGVVGQNRLLFEIRFDQEPIKDRSGFCLYLDLDNDPATGREDEGAKGVDLMAAFDEATGKEPYLQFRNPMLDPATSRMKTHWEDSTLFITIETPLPDQPAAIRTYFLSTKDQGASNNATPSDTLMEVQPSSRKLPELH